MHFSKEKKGHINKTRSSKNSDFEVTIAKIDCIYNEDQETPNQGAW